MPPEEHFWELLVGNDVIAPLLGGDGAAHVANRASSRPEDSSEWDSAPTALKLLNSSGGNQARKDLARDIESVLQMTGDELCRQPVCDDAVPSH